MNSTIDGILIVDSQGKKIIQNRRTIEIWKIPPEIIEDPNDEKQVEYVMHKVEKPKEFVDKINYLYKHQEKTSRDEVKLNDGTVLDRYSAPVIGQNGQYYGRIWVFRDITERKQTEENTLKSLHEKEILIRELYHPELALLPIGSHYVMNPAEAALACRLIRPKWVIPMHYGTAACNLKLAPLSKFLKEMGLGSIKPQPSLKVTKSMIPEETRVIVLDHQH